jgi:uncharacterized protein YceH (UPF0502 family)
MIELTADEARALGVLIEKAFTTPEQYPLSLNALTSGCNQKNNRDPVLAMTDDQAFDAVEGLRAKGLVVRIEAGGGSRVQRFRHNATDALHVRAGELAILAEMLLRGPQTQGELRGRASRMQPIETLDVVRDLLRALMSREEPLARELPPSPGSRAERFEQLLCPESYEVEETPIAGEPASVAASPPKGGGLADRVSKLESEVAELRDALNRIAKSLGEPEINQSADSADEILQAEAGA